MTTVALGEVVDFYSGATPSKAKPDLWNGNLPWFSAKDMKRPRLSDSVDHVAEAAIRSTSLRKLPAGTVVMVVRGMILAHTVPISILDVEASINQDLKALLPRREIDSSFLAAMLRAQHDVILSQVSTAAHGTKKLETRVLENIRIPLPSLKEQRRIAAILDRAEALRAKRRQMLSHLDALTHSIFFDMFGDPDETVAAGSFRLFSDVVAQLQGGRNLVADDSSAPTKHRVLKISAVTGFRYRPSESKPLPDEYTPPQEHFVRPGDLLMSRANTTELVGAVALVQSTPGNLVLPDKLWRLVWRDRDSVEPTYVWALLQTPAMRRELGARSSGTGGSMKNISKAKLGTLRIPWPSLDQQQEFARRLASVETLRRQREHADLSDLFESLQSLAFLGRL